MNFLCKPVVLFLMMLATLSVKLGAELADCDSSQAASGSTRMLGSAATERRLGSTDNTARAYSEPEFYLAILDPAVRTVLISVPRIALNISTFQGVLASHQLSVPVSITRNLTFCGAPEMPRWPVLDLKYHKGLFKLQGGVVLNFVNLTTFGIRSDSPARVPGLDLVVPDPNGSPSYLAMGPGLVITPVCYGPEQLIQDFSSVRQPPGAPLLQYSLILPKPRCVSNTSAPYEDQCWPLMGSLNKVVVYGMDEDATGRLVPNSFILIATNLKVFCVQVVTAKCVQEQTSPYFCLLALMQSGAARYEELSMGGVSAVLTPPSEAAPDAPEVVDLSASVPTSGPVEGGSGGGGGGGLSTAVLISVVTVGCVGAVVIAFSVLLVVYRRRQKTMSEDKPIAESTPGAGGPSERCPVSSAPQTGLSQSIQATSRSASEPEVLGQWKGSQSPSAATGNSSAAPPSSSTTNTGTESDDTRQLPSSRKRSSSRLPRKSAYLAAGQASPSGECWSTGIPVTTKVPTRADLVMNVQLEVNSELTDNVDQPAASGSGSLLGASHGNAVQLLPVVRGKGGFGRVVEGMYMGQKVAVKMMAEVLDCDMSNDALVLSFEREVQVLGRCQHPNIVRLLAACIQPPRLCLVLELMETSLEHIMYRNPASRDPMPLEKVLYIGIEACRALSYLHPTIVHRDLKPANVLVNDPWNDRPIVKLTDFGLSRLRDTVAPTKHADEGTPAYMAPECFDTENNIITHKADMYSLGVLLWEMLAGRRPWPDHGNVAIAFMVTYCGKRPPLDELPPQRRPRKLARLIGACWESDPARRPAADELAKELTLLTQQLQQHQHEPCEEAEQQQTTEQLYGQK